MLFITGLLTLLAIAQAGGDHVKGGSRIKGGSTTQEHISQADIPASLQSFNVKTEVPFGSKVARQDVVDTDSRTKTAAGSKTAISPSLHHSVKTVADASGKSQPSPSLHHTATLPVAQDQVTIDNPTASAGIKTLKAAVSGKTRFSQQDKQVRDPVVHPVRQTVKTVPDPVPLSTKSVGIRKTRLRDTATSPVIQSVKNVAAHSTGSRQIKTLKTVGTSNNPFIQDATQVRDPIALPVVQTAQVAGVPTADTVNRVKTLKSAAAGKTRFSHDDSQHRDPVSKPVLQQVKTAAASKSRKTAIKTLQSSNTRVSSNVPQSVVSYARRDSVLTSAQSTGLFPNEPQMKISSLGRTPNLSTGSDIQSGLKLSGIQGGLTLDEDTFNLLQNAGGITTENGEIAINEKGLQILEATKGESNLRHSSESLSAINEGRRTSVNLNNRVRDRPTVTSTNLLRTPEFGQRQRLNSLSDGITTGGRQNLQGINRSSGLRTQTIATRTQTVLFNGKEISIPGAAEGQTFDENLQPISHIQRGPQVISNIEKNSLQSIKPANRPVLRSPTQTVIAPRDQLNVRAPISTTGVITGSGIQTVGTRVQTVLFNGKEVSLTGAAEGQIFDENLQPLSGVSRGPQTPEIRAAGTPQVIKPATRPVVRSRTQSVTASRDQLRTRAPISTTGVNTESGRQIIRTRVQTVGIRPQTVRESSQTVLFNGKEISLTGAAEGQIFDENLQPLSGGARGPQTPDIRTANTPQVIKPATRPVVRSRTQTVTASRDQLRVRAPVSVTGISAGSGRQIIGTGAQTIGTRSQSVLFNGKEINLTGATAGQIFDENLQPLSGIARGPQTPEIRTVGTPQVTKPYTRQVVGSRTQTLTTSRDQLSLKAPYLATGVSTGNVRQTVGNRAQTVLFNGKEISLTGAAEGQIFDENLQPLSGVARGPQTPEIRTVGAPQVTKPAIRPVTRSRTQTVTGSRDQLKMRAPISTAGVSADSGRQIIGTRTQTVGIRPQTVGTRTQTVLFNGKEISLTGAAEGQIFDENLLPLSGGTRGPQTPDIRTAITPQVMKPATRPVVRSRTQTVTASRDQLRVRAPISATGINGGSGRQIIGSRTQTVGTKPQTVGSRSQTVLFNGKEISLTGAAEGQIFDENLQPLSGVARGPQTPEIRTVGTPQVTKPAIRPVIRSRTQTVTASRDQLKVRAPTSTAGVSADSGRQIIGTRAQTVGIRPQTVGTRSQTVLFNGKEISLTGAAEGQIFDENLQPLSGGARGPQTPDIRTANTPQVIKPATRPVVRSRTQTVTASNDQLRVRAPVSVTGISASSGRQIIGTGAQTIGTRSQSVLFNGKEISLTGATEGQIFDENLQTLSGIARGPQTTDIRAAGTPQVTKPYTRQVVGSRTQTLTTSRDQLSLKAPYLATGVSPGSVRQTVGNRAQTVLFNGKEISLTGAAEGQIFDENLQPLSGVARGPQTPEIRAVGAPQVTKLATRPVVRSRTQAVTASRDQLKIRTPISTAGVTADSGRQIIGTRTQTVGIRPQTVGTRTQTVLFNGKEISLTGAAEGQIFDENLQPLSGGARGPQKPDIRTAITPQVMKPATRPVVRSRTQTVTASREQLRVRAPISATGINAGSGRQIIGSRTQTVGTKPQTVGSRSQTVLFNGKEISLTGAPEGQIFDENLQPLSGVARGPQTPEIRTVGTPQVTKPAIRPVIRSRTQTVTASRDQLKVRAPTSTAGVSADSGRQIIGTRAQTVGIRPQTVGTRSQTVLFNGKEISLTGAAEGQIFDENLQPLSGGARGPQTPDIRTANTPQVIKPATRPVVRSRTQTVTASRDELRVRSPISATGINAGSGRQIIGSRTQTVGTKTQTVGSRSQTVLFNGKEISLTGAAEGQIFDENLQPLSGVARGPQTPEIRTVGTPQVTKPAIRPVIRSRTQTVTASRDQLKVRAPTSTAGVSADSGRQIIGTRAQTVGIRSQTVGTRSQTVLFNGKEISLTGAAEGQIFDENLQPLSGGARGPQTPDIRTANTPQVIKPATRPVVRSRTQTVTASRDELRVRAPISATGINAGSGRQIIGSRTQTVGTKTQTVGSRSQTVLFNGKEISLTGAAEGQIFDENLQPLSGVARGPQTSEIRTVGAPQVTKPAIRPVIRSRTQTVTASRDQLKVRAPTSTAGVSADSGRQIIGTRAQTVGIRPQTVGTRSQTVLFNGKEISLTGAAEGQIFDENLQPLSGGARGPQIPDIRTANTPQVIKPATRPVVRSRTQTVTDSRDQLRVRAPVSATGINTGSGRQIIGSRTQTVVTKPQTVGARSQTVLFNGKEISLTGAAEGQIFDENLQPLSGVARGPQTPDIRAVGTPQVTKPAIRPVVRSRTQTVTASRDQLRVRAPISTAGVIADSGRQVIGTRAQTVGIRPQTIGARPQTVLFNGKEISLAGATEGQIFDENLQPLSGFARGPQTGDIRAVGTPQVIKPAIRPISNQNSPVGSVGISDSLPFIDVTRSGVSQVAPIDNKLVVSRYSSLYGSRGVDSRDKTSQEKIAQDQVEASLIQQKHETSYMADIQQKIHLNEPSTKILSLSQKTLDPTESKQTQLNIDDILEQKPSGFSQIAEVSQKNILDIPTVQQKLLGGDFAEYLPKSSFLPPFNYALPQLAQSKYSVKKPIIQEQQKLEQLFI